MLLFCAAVVLLFLQSFKLVIASTTSSSLPGFTMIIATYQRDSLLPPLLSHLTTFPPPSLRQILLVWQNVGSPLPTFLLPEALAITYESSGVRICVRISEENSMNERFRPFLNWGEEIETEAVMIMDDDVVLRKNTLEWGYQQFVAANPVGSDLKSGRIVGFAGRDYVRKEDAGWGYVVQPKDSYSIVLSNAAWMRREWLEFYWAETVGMRELREYVDEVFNCDDLLINFLVSNLTHLPPLLLQPSTPLRTVPTKGLWNRASAPPDTQEDLRNLTTTVFETPSPKLPILDHFHTRSVCLEKYFSTFEKYNPTPNTWPSYPLIQTDYAISQDITDHARVMSEDESWEAPVWILVEPTPEQLENEEIAAEEIREQEEWEQMLERMSDEEIEVMLVQLEEEIEREEFGDEYEEVDEERVSGGLFRPSEDRLIRGRDEL